MTPQTATNEAQETSVFETSGDLSHSGDQPLRILFSSADFRQLQKAIQDGEGDATYLLQSYISKGLASRGHRLTYLAGGALCETIQAANISEPTPAPLGWTGGFLFELIRRVCWRLQKPLGIPYLNYFSNWKLRDAALRQLASHDVVYERNALYRDGVARACRRTGVPLVLFVEADEIMEHDYMGVPITGLLRKRASQSFRYNLRAASRIICVSDAVQRRLVEQWKIDPRRILVFPNGVDVKRFRPDPAARNEIRAELGLGDRPMVLFLGNFYAWHDVASLLRAFALTLRSHPRAMLVLVGDGVRRKSMEKLATELGLAESVRFVGLVPHEQAPRYLAAADVSVAPYISTKEEIWFSPLKVYESMACGSAVVASAVGQVTQVIEHGETGLLTAPEDIEGLDRAIRELLDDPDKRDRIGAAACRQVAANNSWERYFTKLEDVCRTAIQERRAN